MAVAVREARRCNTNESLQATNVTTVPSKENTSATNVTTVPTTKIYVLRKQNVTSYCLPLASVPGHECDHCSIYYIAKSSPVCNSASKYSNCTTKLCPLEIVEIKGSEVKYFTCITKLRPLEIVRDQGIRGQVFQLQHRTAVATH